MPSEKMRLITAYGVRNVSAATRQHYIQIYQAIKYLSLDVAEFIEKGPQMTGPLRV